MLTLIGTHQLLCLMIALGEAADVSGKEANKVGTQLKDVFKKKNELLCLMTEKCIRLYYAVVVVCHNNKTCCLKSATA